MEERSQPPTSSNIDYRQEFKTHFEQLSKYLATYLANAPPNARSSAKQKLSRITTHQFYELSTDTYDELRRRQYANEIMPFLPHREKLHPKRNKARRTLATLPTSRFQDLASDVHHGLSRRLPELNEDGSARGPSEDMRQCPSEVMFVTNDNKEITHVSRGVP
ncbi:hypothetical protein CPB85DRAFT_1249728 [Mucidula mucida]|nr:hypothetical protein CPB85DRAFT_1249728 [Mucidula mucida]